MLFFDLEADNLLPRLTQAHCLTIIDHQGNIDTFTHPEGVRLGAKKLMQALQNKEIIVGHNIIDYDLPALEKLYPQEIQITKNLRKYVVDTLVLSRLIYSELGDKDMGLIKKDNLPARLRGSHSLKAWGYRLGELKGTYAEETENAWTTFNEEMLAYNIQDVKVTIKLFQKLNTKSFPQTAIELEHKTQWLISRMKQNGFPFDKEKAEKLEQNLRTRHAILDSKLRSVVPQIPDKIFVPKRDNKKLGYIKGIPIQRYKDFNPNSRQQIEWLLLNHFSYHPEEEELYEGDRLKIDDNTFRYISEDEKAPQDIRELASIMEEYLMITKRLGQLIDGKYGWLKMIDETDGRIHGSVNPCGAVTGRATHASPNIAQVPSVSSPYGKECRELFCAPPAWYQAGVDASGLELRCLAHYMARYDGGAYAHEILNGDIHTANQKAAGLPERNMAKTFIYGFLYGAGDEKIGKIVHGDAKDGKRLKKKFLEQTPAIANLKEAIKNTLVEKEKYGKILKWKRKFLRGLDGRPLTVRSLHSALNLLLQSAGALICKYWIIRLEERLLEQGLHHGADFQYMAWVHDEVQVACRTYEIAEIVVSEAQEAMRDTEKYFKFRVRLDTEGKIGKNWKDCH